MSAAEVLSQIQRILDELARAKGASVGAIGESTSLFGGGLPIDSLDVASLVVELDEITGYDPFRAGFVEFRTAGELARLYAR